MEVSGMSHSDSIVTKINPLFADGGRVALEQPSAVSDTEEEDPTFGFGELRVAPETTSPVCATSSGAVRVPLKTMPDNGGQTGTDNQNNSDEGVTMASPARVSVPTIQVSPVTPQARYNGTMASTHDTPPESERPLISDFHLSLMKKSKRRSPTNVDSEEDTRDSGVGSGNSSRSVTPPKLLDGTQSLRGHPGKSRRSLRVRPREGIDGLGGSLVDLSPSNRDKFGSLRLSRDENGRRMMGGRVISRSTPAMLSQAESSPQSARRSTLKFWKKKAHVHTALPGTSRCACGKSW